MSAPTDLELMMYFDGELPEPRASEVRAFVEGSSTSRQKLDGLSLVGVAVRERANAAEAGFPDLADAIMTKVGRADASVAPKPKSAPATAPAGARARVLEASKKVDAAAPAANENGRLIFGLAAFAAVAAAAMFLWGRSPAPAPSIAAGSAPELAPLDPSALAPAATAEASLSSTSSASPQPIALEEEAPPPSAEVAAVDFGSRNGMVYYVAVANQPTTTTVVWVRDE